MLNWQIFKFSLCDWEVEQPNDINIFIFTLFTQLAYKFYNIYKKKKKEKKRGRNDKKVLALQQNHNKSM